MAGLVRLQWWRDALEGLAAGQPLAHPVVEALHAALGRFAPLRSRLDAAIDAREEELSAGPPADLAALEERLASSWGEITLGAMELLEAADEAGARRRSPSRPGAGIGPPAADTAGGPAAEPDAVARARCSPGTASRARAWKERERPPRCGRSSPTWRRARARIWRQSRRHRHAVPQRALAALLPASLLDGYLRRLARAGFDPFAPVPTAPGAFAPLRLLGRYARGRY